MYKGLLTASILIIGSTALAGVKSICGLQDDRALSFEPKVGRLAVQGERKGCTVTMISDSCAVSAGHCKEVLDQAEFNTPISVEGEPQPAAAEDTYLIDQESIVHQFEGPGKDWAVFQIKPNAITGKLPGQVQGYYEVSFAKPSKGSELRITGYGYDSGDMDKNFAQQSHTGTLKKVGGLFNETLLEHTVDTMGGNSGSSIIDESSQKIVGIHTHAGCWTNGGANKGTLISAHKELKAAIKACLARD